MQTILGISSQKSRTIPKFFSSLFNAENVLDYLSLLRYAHLDRRLNHRQSHPILIIIISFPCALDKVIPPVQAMKRYRYTDREKTETPLEQDGNRDGAALVYDDGKAAPEAAAH